MFGVGRCGGIEKTSLISLTSEDRRARLSTPENIALSARRPKWPRQGSFRAGLYTVEKGIVTLRLWSRFVTLRREYVNLVHFLMMR